MAKVKLDIDNKTDEELRDAGTAHKTAMVGNANFPTPNPTPAVYDAALADFVTKINAEETAKTALATARAATAASRVTFAAHHTTRGSHVQDGSLGDEAKILSAAFGVQAVGTPTTSLPQPANFRASIGDNAGEIDVACNAVKRAKSYVIERREHIEGQPPGPWTQAKISSRSTATITGLVSGRQYAFRIRALGPNDVTSPWSDEAICMAA